MDSEVIQSIQDAANRGIEALKRHDAAQASLDFDEALQLCDDVRDERARRDEVSILGSLFDHCGFPDLSLLAAEEAVDLDRKLGLEHELAGDLLNVGNAYQGAGNRKRAEEVYREVLALCLKRNELANAASANTNIAGMVADRGDWPAAIEMLKQSLAWLAQEPFPDTEKNTRLALVQLMDFTARSGEDAIDNARVLYAKFFDELPASHRKAAAAAIAATAERYLTAHENISRVKWLNDNFPGLDLGIAAT